MTEKDKRLKRDEVVTCPMLSRGAVGHRKSAAAWSPRQNAGTQRSDTLKHKVGDYLQLPNRQKRRVLRTYDLFSVVSSCPYY
jgi:hypothetical protein